MTELTHLDSDGRARMVDVGHKAVTSRSATASGRFVTTAEVIALVRADGMPKADVLATARIAGIQGAKKTSELIPLCHPLPLSSVTVDFSFEPTAIVITATAKTTGQTGVEMEALTAVAIAGLTLHDMVKAVDASATMTDVRLDTKTGGKTGHWTRSGAADFAVTANTAIVIVSSTRAAAGEYADTTGPQIAAWLEERHYSTQTEVVADAEISLAISAAVGAHPAVIITTGGTGVSASVRQSIRSACPASPAAEIIWSMMPQLTPTHWFSARWPSCAISVGDQTRLPATAKARNVASSTAALDARPAPSGTSPASDPAQPVSARDDSRSAHAGPRTYSSQDGPPRAMVMRSMVPDSR